jgi:hypothetical protein
MPKLKDVIKEPTAFIAAINAAKDLVVAQIESAKLSGTVDGGRGQQAGEAFGACFKAMLDTDL